VKRWKRGQEYEADTPGYEEILGLDNTEFFIPLLNANRFLLCCLIVLYVEEKMVGDQLNNLSPLIKVPIMSLDFFIIC
jgi:hypothetical protein